VENAISFELLINAGHGVRRYGVLQFPPVDPGKRSHRVGARLSGIFLIIIFVKKQGCVVQMTNNLNGTATLYTYSLCKKRIAESYEGGGKAQCLIFIVLDP
jgi:hypothetical protein